MAGLPPKVQDLRRSPNPADAMEYYTTVVPIFMRYDDSY